MPIKVYWKVQKVQKNIDFLQSSGGTQAETNAELRNFLRILAPWIINEQKRLVIMDKAGKA